MFLIHKKDKSNKEARDRVTLLPNIIKISSKMRRFRGREQSIGSGRGIIIDSDVSIERKCL